jgi:hypothetical protein
MKFAFCTGELIHLCRDVIHPQQPLIFILQLYESRRCNIKEAFSSPEKRHLFENISAKSAQCVRARICLRASFYGEEQ